MPDETSCKFQDALATILYFQRANALHQRSFENSTMESWMHVRGIASLEPSNLKVRMTTRALPGRLALRMWQKEEEGIGEIQREAFEMRRSKKRRGWRKMLRSQRGHTVDDILFLAFKPLRHLDIFQVFSVPLMPFLPHRRK